MSHGNEIECGPNICIAENREIEIDKKFKKMQMAKYVWEKCRPTITSTEIQCVCARKVQLMRMQLHDKKRSGKDPDCQDSVVSGHSSLSTGSEHKKRSTSVLFTRTSQEYAYDTTD